MAGALDPLLEAGALSRLNAERVEREKPLPHLGVPLCTYTFLYPQMSPIQ